MKKIIYFFSVIIIITFITSCGDDNKELQSASPLRIEAMYGFTYDSNLSFVEGYLIIFKTEEPIYVRKYVADELGLDVGVWIKFVRKPDYSEAKKVHVVPYPQAQLLEAEYQQNLAADAEFYEKLDNMLQPKEYITPTTGPEVVLPKPNPKPKPIVTKVDNKENLPVDAEFYQQLDSIQN